MRTDKKILVIGCRGMLGADLMRALPAASGVDIDEVDITDSARVSGLLKKEKPHTVIHAAAFTDVDGAEAHPEKAYGVNSFGTLNVAAACRETGAVLLYISTDYVFDGKKETPYAETDTPGPLCVYGRSKLAGEFFVRDIAGKFFIVRTSWLYGMNGKNFVKTVLSLAKEKTGLEMVSDQKGSPTRTTELIPALLELIEKEEYGIYHITGDGSCSWHEFAEKIIELKGLKTNIAPVPAKNCGRPAPRPENSVLDNSKINSLINNRRKNWAGALKEYLLAV